MSTIGIAVRTAVADGDTLAILPIAIPLAGIAAALAKLAWGCARAGVIVRPDHVVVRNPWTTYRLAISEIDRFVPGLQPPPPLPHSTRPNPTPGMLVLLRDGSEVAPWALAREGLVWNSEQNVRRWWPVAEKLNTLIETPEPAGRVPRKSVKDAGVTVDPSADG